MGLSLCAAVRGYLALDLRLLAFDLLQLPGELFVLGGQGLDAVLQGPPLLLRSPQLVAVDLALGRGGKEREVLSDGSMAVFYVPLENITRTCCGALVPPRGGVVEMQHVSEPRSWLQITFVHPVHPSVYPSYSLVRRTRESKLT